MRNNSGFTIMELAIVIAIIGILAGIAIPNIIGLMPRYRLKSAVLDLSSNMQRARLTAIKQNTTCTVTFDAAHARYDIDCLGNTIELDPENTVRFSALDGGSLQFNSRGMAQTVGPFSLSLANNSDSYTIRISPCGSVVSERN
jgi:type IV fimbrial biogenesis protein FimT